ncbi:hypothetical protein I8752_18960 [Nostocaceae cyanobacterium CENA369]|uniref:Uncharacterized protein n=1 Tax=Dendronalium phyllosphericum CENA369 TaxID=1725256 RepID=A0A8J7LGM6_9NOST|nr:hypothetical protein [Dendronalium phyllosphericum]MBH8575059.1 hypothetical protein [Dendronalium phyllosphericum CENA369]
MNVKIEEYTFNKPIKINTITWSTSFYFHGLENQIIISIELDEEAITETIKLRRTRYLSRSRACGLLWILIRQSAFTDDDFIAAFS